LDKINILRIAGSGLEMELVKRCPAPEGEGLRKHWVTEDLNERSADDEVLLDLDILNPRGL
jgi:hypothetical protein